MMLSYWKRLFCFAWMPLYFGGDSSSTSASTTNNIDQRATGGNGSQNVSASGGATVNVTDAGAISQAFGFADSALKGAYTDVAASRSNTASTAGAAIAAVQNTSQQATQAITDAFSKSSAQVADAYSTAKAGENKILVAAGLVVVGIVAVKVMGK